MIYLIFIKKYPVCFLLGLKYVKVHIFIFHNGNKGLLKSESNINFIEVSFHYFFHLIYRMIQKFTFFL